MKRHGDSGSECGITRHCTAPGPVQRDQRILVFGQNGSANADTITVASSITLPATIFGGNGNDSITGGAGNDRLAGGNANDTVNGGARNDTLAGSRGTDSLSGQDGDDHPWVRGDRTGDTANGGLGTDVVHKDNNDTILATEVTDNGSSVAVWRPASAATYYVDVNGDNSYTTADSSFQFGNSSLGDVPLTGDWNGDGIRDLGVWRNSDAKFYLDYDGDGTFTSGVDVSFPYGVSNSDVPVIGDWNNDGIDDVGVWRPGAPGVSAQFYLDSNGDRTYTAGDWAQFGFGTLGDTPVAGDWNNDGVDDVGVWRPGSPGGVSTFYLDSNGDRAYSGADATFGFGTAGDKPFVGDWNGDGQDDVAVLRYPASPGATTIFLDSDGDRDYDANDLIGFLFGATGDLPVIV